MSYGGIRYIFFVVVKNGMKPENLDGILYLHTIFIVKISKMLILWIVTLNGRQILATIVILVKNIWFHMYVCKGDKI